MKTVDQIRKAPTTRAMELVHYGSSRYDPSKFQPISDERWIKPRGGLWTSPVQSEHGWKYWCEAEEFNLYKLKESFRIGFYGRVFTIDSVDDMNQLAWCEPKTGWHFPLWEPLLLCGYDAAHLTWRGQIATRHSHPRNLYGWDCETVLVMNPDCIRPI